MGDVGNPGSYEVKKIDQGALLELRNVAGMPPIEGKHWVMVDLDTGQLKWYRSSRRQSRGMQFYPRRPYRKRY